jgi:hypothetical protein
MRDSALRLNPSVIRRPTLSIGSKTQATPAPPSLHRQGTALAIIRTNNDVPILVVEHLTSSVPTANATGVDIVRPISDEVPTIEIGVSRVLSTGRVLH